MRFGAQGGFPSASRRVGSLGVEFHRECDGFVQRTTAGSIAYLRDLHNAECQMIGMGGWLCILKEMVMSEAGGVAGNCSQASEKVFMRGSCALHVHAQVLGASARVAQMSTSMWIGPAQSH